MVMLLQIHLHSSTLQPLQSFTNSRMKLFCQSGGVTFVKLDCIIFTFILLCV